MTWTQVAMLASIASAAPDRAAKIERYLFDLCPKVVAGEVDLRDSEQIKAYGLAPSSGPGGWTWTLAGGKKRSIRVGFRQFTGKRVCQVGFEGRDSQALYRSVVRAGEARGWRSGAGAAELGGFISFLYAPEPSRQKILFTHWPEHEGLQQATHAGLILDDAERVKP